MKATEGLSELAKQMLAIAGHELDRRTVRQLWALMPPPTEDEILKLFEQVRAEILARKKIEPMLEARRLAWLKRLNELNPE